VGTLVQKLKKVLEVYKSPISAYPGIRKSTIELMTWMVRNNANYIEILLKCGVYEQLEEVVKTSRKLENFELFYCDVGIGHHETPICSLATALRDQLSLSPKFQERYGNRIIHYVIIISTGYNFSRMVPISISLIL